MGTRMRADAIRGKNEYEIYADRGMYESELRRIWDCQRKYHRNLTDEMLNEISGALFFQRPLKIPERGFAVLSPAKGALIRRIRSPKIQNFTGSQRP